MIKMLYLKNQQKNLKVILIAQEKIQKNTLLFLATIKKDLDNDKAVIYKLKFIDSYRFMDRSLASLVDNLSEINKKKPMVEFIDNFRSMLASLSCHLNNLSEINKKTRKSENKLDLKMRTLDLCYFHYHILLMIYLKLIRKNQKINLLIALDLFRRYY